MTSSDFYDEFLRSNSGIIRCASLIESDRQDVIIYSVFDEDSITSLPRVPKIYPKDKTISVACLPYSDFQNIRGQLA